MWASSCQSLGGQRPLDLRELVKFVDNIPGQEILDAIELTALDQTINDRRAFSAAVRSEEQIILASDSSTTNGSLGDVVVYDQQTVLRVETQRLQAVE